MIRFRVHHLVAAAALVLAGCAASDSVDSSDDVADDADALSSLGGQISRSEVLARAQYWVDKHVMYSQDQSKAASDGDGHAYRPDCSGMVSMAWHMTKLSDGWDRNTASLSSSDLVQHLGSYDELKAGDALDGVGYGHIVLFDKWADASHSTLWIYQESDYGLPAEHVVRNVSWYRANGFAPIRYKEIEDAPPPPPGPPTAAPKEPTGCGTIKPGEGLAPGHVIKSCDGRFELAMQSDGNLVVYHVGGSALWSSNTHGTDGYAAEMQSDGNFVLYGRHSNALWASHSSGHGGARLVIQTDGNLVVYGTDNHALWASGTNVPADPGDPTGCGIVKAGQGLSSGETFKSCNGAYTLAMQADGNLVLYHAGKGALWATGTDHSTAWNAVMQSDGNFVLYDLHGKALWSSHTSGDAGARLAIQDDGNLVVYTTANRAVWASGTNGR